MPRLSCFSPHFSVSAAAIGLAAMLCVFATPAAMAQAACESDNPVISAMQQKWNTPAPSGAEATDGFGPVQAALLPIAQAQAQFGPLSFKSKKQMQYALQLRWHVSEEGDYWLAADSGAWIDVVDGGRALEPLTFNHGLRCAGIHKALKFHLRAGDYLLRVGSDETPGVKIAAGRP